jgi:hypothetical protein
LILGRCYWGDCWWSTVPSTKTCAPIDEFFFCVVALVGGTRVRMALNSE